MKRQQIYSMMDTEQRVLKFGFLPFFTCGIPGFSIEEMITPNLWFSDEEDEPKPLQNTW